MGLAQEKILPMRLHVVKCAIEKYEHAKIGKAVEMALDEAAERKWLVQQVVVRGHVGLMVYYYVEEDLRCLKQE